MKNFFNNRVLKIVALMISLGLWFYVLNSEATTTEKDYRIDYILPKNYAIANDVPTEILVRLKGPKAFIRTIEQREERVVIDLNHERRLKGNRYKIKLKESYFALPLGVEVSFLGKDGFVVKLADSAVKKVPIHLNIVGKIADNRKLVNSKVSPETVTLIGAAKKLAGLDKIQTRPVDLNRLDGEGKEELALIDLPETIVIKGKRVVEFEYKIVPKEINFTINNVTIKFLSSRYIKKASQRTASLSVFLDDENAKVKNSDVEVIANIPNNAKGRVKVKLEARLKDGIHLMKVNPEEIFVNVR